MVYRLLKMVKCVLNSEKLARNLVNYYASARRDSVRQLHK